MNENHTPGRLYQLESDKSTARAKQGAQSRYVFNAQSLGQEAEDQANARRLVACWNACEGIPTDMLEAMPSGPAALVPMYARLEAQRDELRQALQEYDDAFTGFDPSSKESRHRMRLAVIKARAAIAKTESAS